MRQTLIYTVGGNNTGTSEETLYEPVFDPNFAALDPGPAGRILDAWGLFYSPAGDARIRVYSNSNLVFDTGSDLNDLTGTWIMRIQDFPDGPSILSFTASSFYHKVIGANIIVPHPGSTDFSITAEAENVPGVNLSGVRYFVVDKEFHQV